MTSSTRYFEDIEVGQRREVGRFELSRDEIISFAELYDPQPYHTDPDAAADSAFGELVASGWQTLCSTTRFAVEEFRRQVVTMGGLGIDNLQWTTPVRPGDEITVYDEVVEKRLSESKSDRGLMRERITGINQSGEQVIRYEVVTLVRRDPDRL